MPLAVIRRPADAAAGFAGERMMIRLIAAVLALPLALAAAPGHAAEAQGTTLRFIPQADLRVLDPVWTTAYITRDHGYMIYDTLFALDEHFKPQPQMVDTWTVSDDKLTYTFTLRDKLKFHDGQPVRSADCIASLERWMKRDILGQSLGDAIGEMKAIDERTFAIVLKKPFPLTLRALAKLSGSMPFIMPERIAKTDPNTQIKEAIGSGPFKFVAAEWEPGHKVVYVKNTDYVPRKEPPSWAAGGKVVKVDRVEWIYIPDPSTAANALQAGEVDWWWQVPPDLVPLLEKRGGVTVAATDPIGFTGVFRFNHLHPPFDNVKIRQAVLTALDQTDYMTAVAGDKRFWRTCYSFYTCGTPMASEAGADALKGKRDLEKAKALVKAAGYNGERVVVMDASDYPAVHAEALVTADLLQRLGFNVDLQTSDWGTVLTRRAKRSGVEDGGWSVFHTSFTGPDALDPSVNQGLRANGDKAWFGWPTDPELETLHDRWLDTEDLAAQKEIATALQAEAFRAVPYIPIGQFAIPTAYRNNLSGLITSPVLEMWNVEKK
jgi:peptide/nickel transport system substrate-binding protein